MPPISTPTLLAAALCFAAASARAAGIEIGVADRDGRPIGDVAVYAVPLDAPADTAVPAAAPAVMEQSDNRFVPHVLVVQAGAKVAFPNNDTVSHHVYSFSPAKPFELALYKGNTHPPVTFDVPGVVVLGCNIHDEMLGYIRVVDTPHHALTDGTGTARLDGLAPGRYAVHAWTPRAREDALPEPVTIAVADGAAQRVAIRFAGKLRPPHDHGSDALTWDRY